MIAYHKNKNFKTVEKNLNDKTKDGKYQTLFQQVNAAAFLTTFEGKILEANIKSCDLFGYNWEEIIKLSLKDIFSPDTNWSQFIDEL
ncbi:MAG: PAS domain-containing protein, partial [Candidatus Thermoplasmatota archaeon]|nr:PAS domain-containing protein [Candidatus Thermoplasmatota archaeon]